MKKDQVVDRGVGQVLHHLKKPDEVRTSIRRFKDTHEGETISYRGMHGFYYPHESTSLD
jgi:hypothetical protein